MKTLGQIIVEEPILEALDFKYEDEQTNETYIIKRIKVKPLFFGTFGLYMDIKYLSNECKPPVFASNKSIRKHRKDKIIGREKYYPDH